MVRFMKVVFAFLIVFTLLPQTAFSHGEIYFPKLISRAELETTGIVLLNPDPTVVNVTLYLISPQGARVSSTHMQIGPGAQIAKIASELFPGAATDGWIGISTDAEEMEAFWLTYDSEMTYLDGGPAAQIETIGGDQVIPLAEGNVELTVLCLSGLQSAGRKALEIESHFWIAHMLIGWNFVFLERPEEAITAFETAKQLEPKSPTIANGLVAAHAVAGRWQKALEISRQSGELNPYSQALHQLYLGETDRMYELLSESADQRDT